MLTKEQILSVLKDNISIEQTGYLNGIADLVGMEDAADAILSLVYKETGHIDLNVKA